jgi:hypothetical protein
MEDATQQPDVHSKHLEHMLKWAKDNGMTRKQVVLATKFLIELQRVVHEGKEQANG